MALLFTFPASATRLTPTRRLSCALLLHFFSSFIFCVRSSHFFFPLLPSSFVVFLYKESFRVVQYNVLAEVYASCERYYYCPRSAMMWQFRRQNLLKEILSYNPDVICLQVLCSVSFAFVVVVFLLWLLLSSLAFVVFVLFIGFFALSKLGSWPFQLVQATVDARGISRVVQAASRNGRRFCNILENKQVCALLLLCCCFYCCCFCCCCCCRRCRCCNLVITIALTIVSFVYYYYTDSSL